MKNYILITTFLCLVTVSTVQCSKITDPRLINGQIAQKGQFPWQVGIVAIKGLEPYYCSGAIISDSWILTAAHCVYGADDVVVLYNTLNLDDVDSPNISITLNYLVHEEYDSRTLRNDIGLIYLNSPLPLDDDNVKIITLGEEELKTGTEVTVIGWGTTGDDVQNEKYDVLRYMIVNTIDNEECAAVYGLDVVQSSIVCTDPGNPLKNPCKGDGGDPAVRNADTDPTHVAIFSFLSNYGCEDPDFPAGFTRTAYYRNWIKTVTGV